MAVVTRRGSHKRKSKEAKVRECDNCNERGGGGGGGKEEDASENEEKEKE